MRDISRLLAVARGDEIADLVLRKARIVNVLSGEIHDGDVAVVDGRIAGIGKYKAVVETDLNGAFLAPAFIDGHIHIESAMLTPPEFAKAVVPRGTGAVLADPHEFANVAGTAGIEYVLKACRDMPLDVFVMMPSCVPATPLETSGASIGPAEIAAFLGREGVAGIAEMMNFPGVFLGLDTELAKLELAGEKPVDGHSPGLSGNPLNAYIAAGISSDHECTTLAEAREKLRRGMHILLREGTAEKNLLELLPLVTASNAGNFSFATDDRHPADLMDYGHIDHHVRLSINAGLDPITAFRIASINTARHYRLRDRGAIAPGFLADMISFGDLRDVRVDMVWHRGLVAARGGEYLSGGISPSPPAELTAAVNVRPFTIDALRIEALPGRKIRVIETAPGQIVTVAAASEPLVAGGSVISDTQRDIIKLVVMERHKATGNIGMGFVRGFGLKKGALASTIAHDAHNIIAVGVDDEDIMYAVGEIISMGGGLCVAAAGMAHARLPLPVCGLVSDRPLVEVRAAADSLSKAAREMGCTLPDPFMTLSFLALSPVPALKVTDMGLVDSERFRLTELFI